MVSVVTSKNISNILLFLPLFKDTNNKLYQLNIDQSQLDPYEYSSDFERFIATLYEENFIVTFDWTAWQDEANSYIDNSKLINSASIVTLQKLLTTHVRKERFCSSHLAGLIRNGHFLVILERLKNMETQDKTLNISQRISVIIGDITQQNVDAIVNAANNSLLGGGGVDGAIHRAAGTRLLEECRQLKGCATGEAKITKGYNLPAKWVIHTVGPVWNGGRQGEDELLARCYRSSLALVEQYQIQTIAFPAISTGAYGFPIDRAAQIAVTEIQQFLSDNTTIEQVIFLCFSQSAGDRYLTALKQIAKT